MDDNKLSDPTTFAILAGLRRYYSIWTQCSCIIHYATNYVHVLYSVHYIIHVLQTNTVYMYIILYMYINFVGFSTFKKIIY